VSGSSSPPWRNRRKSWTFQPEEFISQGDPVVLGHFTMRVKATGRISRSQWAHIWTVEGEQVTAFREYVDTAAVSAAHRK
jgi:ketosteroid isomerase-like protein